MVSGRELAVFGPPLQSTDAADCTEKQEASGRQRDRGSRRNGVFGDLLAGVPLRTCARQPGQVQVGPERVQVDGSEGRQC